MGIEPPSPNEIKHKFLEMEQIDIKEYVNLDIKEYECTIKCDGKTNLIKLNINNFMVYSKGNIAFLKSVDESNHIKEYIYIYSLLKDVIKETMSLRNNVSEFVKARKLLIKIYKLYWISCVAHDFELMFEDIDRRESISQLINIA